VSLQECEKDVNHLVLVMKISAPWGTFWQAC